MLKNFNQSSFIQKLKMNFRVVTIPFIIPWEQTASLQTQNGMNAFGAIRDPNIHVNEGQIKLIQVIAYSSILIKFKGALKSETLLPLFEENTKYHASQKGQTSFGAHRKNVNNIVDHHIYESSSKVLQNLININFIGEFIKIHYTKNLNAVFF